MSLVRELQRVADDLVERYPRYPRSAIESLVRRHAEPFRNAKVLTYVPILVRRSAEKDLRYIQDGIAAEMSLVFNPAAEPAS